jgi:hypothetical protein
MGVSDQRHALAELCPRGKRTQRLEEKNPLPLLGIELRSPGLPVRIQENYYAEYSLYEMD